MVAEEPMYLREESIVGSMTSLLGDDKDAPAEHQVFVISVVLTKQITEDKEAYQLLVDAINSVQTEFLSSNDLVCFNIQCPNQSPPKKFMHDNQKYMAKPKQSLKEFIDANHEIRERSKTFEMLSKGKNFDLVNMLDRQ